MVNKTIFYQHRICSFIILLTGDRHTDFRGVILTAPRKTTIYFVVIQTSLYLNTINLRIIETKLKIVIQNYKPQQHFRMFSFLTIQITYLDNCKKQ